MREINCRLQVEASLIVTSFNEEQRISEWVESFMSMTVLPNEIVLVDSVSKDQTVEILKRELELKSYSGNLKIIIQKCNISEGRNLAIQNARNEICLITDFGVKFDALWCECLYEAMLTNDWAGGVYKLVYDNEIQKSFRNLFELDIENMDEKNFLPSSRSFALTKTIHKQVGGYDEKLVIGEDTDLVYRLKEFSSNFKIVKSSIVYWWPRDSYNNLFIQNYKYAYWDGIARNNLGRLKHILFFTSPIFLFLLISIYLNSILIMFCILPLSILQFYSKAFINVKRNNKKYANITDFNVYFVTVVSSLLGFVSGLLRRRSQ